MKISKIIIYKEQSVPEINLEKIKEFIFRIFEIKIEVRDNIFNKLDKNTAVKIANTRIFNLKKSFQKHIPTTEEISIELENQDMSNREEMTLYDGIELNEIVRGDSIFCSTGITTSEMLNGIIINNNECTTETLVTHKSLKFKKTIKRTNLIEE